MNKLMIDQVAEEVMRLHFDLKDAHGHLDYQPNIGIFLRPDFLDRCLMETSGQVSSLAHEMYTQYTMIGHKVLSMSARDYKTTPEYLVVNLDNKFLADCMNIVKDQRNLKGIV